MAEELVNHPAHYGGDTIYETIKVLEAWLTPEQFVGFLRGNAIKYASRAGKKADVKTDLEKAAWYMRYELDYIARLAQGHVGEVRARVLGEQALKGIPKSSGGFGSGGGGGGRGY